MSHGNGGLLQLAALSVIVPPVSLRGYDAKEVSTMAATDTGSETLVQQQFGEEVDINTIVRRFGLTQEMPSGVPGGVYGDFSGISDFESAREAIGRAEAGFMKLPAEVRDRFGNDPGRLISLAHSLPFEDFARAVQPSVVAVAVDAERSDAS